MIVNNLDAARAFGCTYSVSSESVEVGCTTPRTTVRCVSSVRNYFANNEQVGREVISASFVAHRYDEAGVHVGWVESEESAADAVTRLDLMMSL